MDPNLITPFVTSVQNVFSTMLQLPVTVGEPSLHTKPAPSHDVSGIIAMSGEVIGSVVLSFPEEAAVAIVALFCGERLESKDPDFADAVGELVNMVSGGAKASFPANRAVAMSTPNVVVGAGHHIVRSKDIPCIAIPCTTDCGTFTIEVGLRENNENASNTAASAAASA